MSRLPGHSECWLAVSTGAVLRKQYSACRIFYSVSIYRSFCFQISAFTSSHPRHYDRRGRNQCCPRKTCIKGVQKQNALCTKPKNWCRPHLTMCAVCTHQLALLVVNASASHTRGRGFAVRPEQSSHNDNKGRDKLSPQSLTAPLMNLK